MIEPRFEGIPNTATWEERIEIVDTETDEPVDLETEVSDIIVSLRDPRPRGRDYGPTLTEAPILVGKLSDGDGVVFVVPGSGVMGWRFSAAQMGTLEPKLYEIGVRLEILDETAQLLLGRVTIARGL